MTVLNFRTSRLFSLFSVALLVWGPVRAQHNPDPLPDVPPATPSVVLEAGISGGVTNYQGDLASPNRGSFKDAAPLGSVFLRYAVASGLSVRLEVSAGVLKGDDGQWEEPNYRKHRNFKFTSPLFETALLAEYDFLKQRSLGNPKSRFGLYPFAGIGFVYTSPERDFSRFDASYFGSNDPASKWKEDADAPAGNTALVIPLGVGLSYMVGTNTKLFIEGGHRLSFSDKIDGFSHAVASTDSDGYTLYKIGVALGLPRLSARFAPNK